MSDLISVRKFVVLVVGMFLATASLQAQTTWYVDDDAPLGGDGTSWDTAFTHLQDALAAAIADDEIHVAAGTYKPDQDEAGNVTPGDREATFQLISAVGLYGGYAGLADPNNPDDRNVELYETVLSGDIGTPGHASDDSYHVVTASGTDETAVLDGFTITAGNANGEYGDPTRKGGGIYADHGSPTITNCTIVGNVAFYGAGIYCWYSSPVISNCTINGNSAGHDAGGVHFHHYSDPVVTDCLISGNSAGWDGAGICCDWGNPTITNCTIVANTALDHAGGVYLWNSDASFSNCTINGNWSGWRGGGVSCWGGSSPTFTNCTIVENTAPFPWGGAVHCDGSSPIIVNCVLWANTSPAISGSGPAVTYSDVQGGWPGAGNIDADPTFVDPNGPDDIPGTEDDDLHLSAGSPCVNAGDNDAPSLPEQDFEGEQRIQECRVDMGVDESPHFFDCNDNGLSDACDIVTGISEDDNGNGIPDECEPDAWYVDDDAPNDPGPGDPAVSDPLEDGSLEHPFDAIQEAMDVAFQGQDVLVFDGTYTGVGNKNLDFDLKAITVLSQNGRPEACIIDCEGDGRGFLFDGEMSDSVVEGFTITGGYAQRGGGIYCVSGSPTITSCMITGNTAYGVWLSGGGAGIYCYNSSPTIGNCTIAENSASALNSVGGGIRCSDNGIPTITNCAITRNTAGHGGGIFCYGSDPTITNCTLTGNAATDCGGGINCYQYETSPTITNCTLTGNSASIGGAVYCHYYSYTTITNCILWGDAPGELYVSSSSSPVITYCDVQGGCPGEGNIDADPLFVDPDGPDDDPNTYEDNDYRLSAGSPCIDAADNEAVPPDTVDLDDDGDTDEPIPFDLDGNPRFVDDPNTPDTGNGTPPIVDMGAYELQVGIVAHLDIKPGSCPNPLNRSSHGVLPVAVVGTAEFDVTQIDVDTLVLSRADGVGGSVTPLMGPPGPGIRVEDVATPFEGEPCDCHELGGDGIDDLSTKFDTEVVVPGLELNDLPGGAMVELVVSGALSDGTPFTASDCIRLVPPGSGGGLRRLAVGDDGRDVSPESRGAMSPESFSGGASPQQDADQASADADANEESQDAFNAPIAACGAFSPPFLLAPIAALGLMRCRRP